ncbi:MAG TPA: hypothetical protein VM912_10340 [Terriglobales bacterium]|nr:hypothetical protein [Terriglobales bacterium]
MRSSLLLAVILSSSFVLGQSSSRDTHALESMAKEPRQLRQDLVTTTVAAHTRSVTLDKSDELVSRVTGITIDIKQHASVKTKKPVFPELA